MANKRRGHGEGTISQWKDGRWEAKISLPGAKRKAFYGKTRKEVQQKLTTALRDQQQGILPMPEREITGQCLNRWLQDVVKPGVRPRT